MNRSPFLLLALIFLVSCGQEPVTKWTIKEDTSAVITGSGCSLPMGVRTTGENCAFKYLNYKISYHGEHFYTDEFESYLDCLEFVDYRQGEIKVCGDFLLKKQ